MDFVRLTTLDLVPAVFYQVQLITSMALLITLIICIYQQGLILPGIVCPKGWFGANCTPNFKRTGVALRIKIDYGGSGQATRPMRFIKPDVYTVASLLLYKEQA